MTIIFFLSEGPALLFQLEISCQIVNTKLSIRIQKKKITSRLASKMTITNNTELDGGHSSSIFTSSQESILDLDCDQEPTIINAENYFDTTQ